jgi:8-oxo-dGTP pyrophosphatase MutT (NUDIX family)
VEPAPQVTDAGGPCAPAALRQLVTAHRACDPREERSCSLMLEQLDRLPHPCDRDADPVHVTASGIVVGRRGTVLHLHRKLRRWLQPGGHIDAGEHPSAAARREAREETGMVVAHPASGPLLLHVDVHPAAEGHTHLDLRYLLFAGDEDPRPPAGESPLARWWSWQEAESVADDALLGALRKARRAMSQRSEDQPAAARGDGRSP